MLAARLLIIIYLHAVPNDNEGKLEPPVVGIIMSLKLISIPYPDDASPPPSPGLPPPPPGEGAPPPPGPLPALQQSTQHMRGVGVGIDVCGVEANVGPTTILIGGVIASLHSIVSHC